MSSAGHKTKKTVAGTIAALVLLCSVAVDGYTVARPVARVQTITRSS